MYDSRSDHPRTPQHAKSRFRALVKRDQELDDIWCGKIGPRSGVPVRKLIDEQIDEQIDPEGGRMTFHEAYDCEWEFFHALDCDYGVPSLQEEPLAEWEWELRNLRPGQAVADDGSTYEDYLAERERVAAIVWSSEDHSKRSRSEMIQDVERLPHDDEEGDWEPAWLAPVTIREAYDVMGDGFTIEGPKGTWSEQRKEHYVRVYELARDLNVESTVLVHFLCIAGEFVKTHQSWVALPVAKRLTENREALLAELGERKPRPQTWAQMLNEERAKITRTMHANKEVSMR